MSRPQTLISLLALGALVALAGCGGEPATPAVEPGAPSLGPKVEGTIEAMIPCGQVGPFSEALELFQKANPGVEVLWVPENMVPIVRKILDGKAAPDLCLTMGDLEMDLIEEGGRVAEGTRTRYAENSLALMVPKGNPAGVRTIMDLAKPAVKRISIPDPELNSVGKHAVEALKRAGIWEQVKGKVFLMREAAEAKDATAQQQVQASIGYYPCAREVHVPGQAPAQPKNLELVGHVSADLYDPFWCEGAVIEGAKNPDGGAALIGFLMTPEAQEIFRKWHFVREETEPAGGEPSS